MVCGRSDITLSFYRTMDYKGSSRYQFPQKHHRKNFVQEVPVLHGFGVTVTDFAQPLLSLHTNLFSTFGPAVIGMQSGPISCSHVDVWHVIMLVIHGKTMTCWGKPTSEKGLHTPLNEHIPPCTVAHQGFKKHCFPRPTKSKRSSHETQKLLARYISVFYLASQ